MILANSIVHKSHRGGFYVPKFKVTSYALIILLVLVLPSQAFAACINENECEDAAEELGLDIGGAGYDFASDYATKGCYYYKSGKYQGRAYWGTGGSPLVKTPFGEVGLCRGNTCPSDSVYEVKGMKCKGATDGVTEKYLDMNTECYFDNRNETDPTSDAQFRLSTCENHGPLKRYIKHIPDPESYLVCDPKLDPEFC